MNYYIVTSDIFESLDNDQIRYAHKSQDRTKWIATTELTVDDVILTFETSTALSEYTLDTHSDWTGDGGGISIEDIEETEYLSGL
tara:strand:- start:148 stop:402 length:255 start_codon:yes stop_codon:yes gene_type:complete